MKVKHLLGSLAVASLCGSAAATQAEVPIFNVRSIAVVGTAFGAHSAGNMEITGTFTLPGGLNCDPTYVTTSRAADPDRAMFAILKSAFQKKLPVAMRLSDWPVLAAFPGRCSIVAVGYPGTLPPAPGATDPEPTVPPTWCGHAQNGVGC